MAQPQMVVRIAGTLDELKRNLREGKDQIETTTAAMKKLASSLDGSKLEQRAHNIVAAVNEIGGATKLTDREQARLNTTLQQYIEKSERMGRTVPGHLRELATATQAAEDRIKGAGRATELWTKAAGMLAGVLSIAAIKSAVSGYLEITGALADLSAKTRIGTSELQRLKYAAEQNGGTLDQVANAALKLGTKIAGGDQSALGALKALGLSASELRKLGLDQALFKVADAAAKVSDPMAQAKIQMDLFGKAGNELLPMMRGNLAATAAEAERLGLVISEKDVKAGDEFSDVLDALTLRGRVLIAEVLGPMVPALTSVAQELGSTIPAGMEKARSAIDALVRGAMLGQIALFEMAVSMAQLSSKMPTLRALTGESAKDVALYQGHLQRAKDTLDNFAMSTGANAAANTAASKAIAQLNVDYAGTAKALKDVAERAKAVRDLWNEIGISQMNADKEQMDRRIKLLDAYERAQRATANEVGLLWMQLDKQMMDAIKPDWLAKMLVPLKESVSAIPPAPAWESAWGSIGTGLSSVLDGLPALLTQAFTGGGGILGAVKAIGVQLADAIIRPLLENMTRTQRIGVGIGAGLGAGIGGAIGGAAGSSLGGTVAGLAGALGAGSLAAGGIGAAAVGIFKLIQHNRHLNDEVKKYNAEIGKLRTQLLEQHGTLEDLDRKARALGLSFDANWGHQGQAGLEAFNKLIKEFEARLANANAKFGPLLQSADALGIRLPAALLESIGHLVDIGVLTDSNVDAFKRLAGAAEVDWKKMQAAAERYGINVDNLGQQFNQLRSNASAQQIIDDFDLMTRGGASVGAVLSGMQQEMSAFVQETKRAGTTIPENMKPWIQEMVRARLLVNENGEVLEDLEGIKFGDRVKTEFEKITDAIRDLIDAIKGPLTDAIRNLPQPDLRFDSPSFPGNGAEGPIPMARGGDFMVTRPTLFLAGEAGPERATFTPGGSGGARSIAVTVQLPNGRPLVDFVIDEAGNRLAVRGGR